MSDIYKIIYLNGKIITKIHVFFGHHDIDNINLEFKKNPANKLFENVFSNEELTKISSGNIQVEFIKMKIYIDDTISTIKKKIIQAYSLHNDIGICFEEIYLFCKNVELLNNIEIFQNLSQNGKLEITKERLFQYVTNIEDIELDKIPIKDFYTFDDIINLDLNNKKKIIDNSIGQKSLRTIKSYSYTVNPFQVSHFDSLIEKNTETLISTTNNYNLMKQDFMLNNSIYVCLFGDVIKQLKDNNINEVTGIKLYFPFLNELEIKSIEEFSIKQTELLEKSKALIDDKFIKNIDNIDLFYNIYNNRKSDITYIEQGIKYIDLTLYPIYKLIMPLDVIFKLIHASKNIPFIKYNYSNRQEKIYRLYCDKTAKNGKKIPFLSKNTIIKLAKTIGKNKSITCYVNNDKTNSLYFQLDVNGNISVQIDLKNSETIENIQQIINESVNPIILIIKDYLMQSGYEYNTIHSLYDENIDINEIKYFSYLTIDKNIQLYNLIGCVSSIFNVLLSELKKGIVMRYKRVSNFNELDSQQAFIIEMLNKSNYETDILKGLMDNFQLNEDEAKLKIATLLDEVEIEQNLNKNRKLRVKNNPGFLTKITQDQFQNNIAIEVSNINDIKYLQTIPIYVDSLIRITQNIDSTSVPETYINKLCNTEKEDIIEEINDVIAHPEKKYTESLPVSIKAQDLVFDELHIENEASDNKSSTILDMLYGDDDEEEEEEEDDEQINGGGPKLKIIDSAALKNDITGMSLNNPNPFFSKMVKRDPKLFLTKGDGKYNAYSRSCPWNIRRQPVILTDKEKENIDKNHPGSYEHAIKYGSSPENQNWYICPRYWNLKTNTSLTKEEVDSGKYGNVIPAKATEVLKNTSIFEFTDSKAHIDNDGKYVQHYPGFLKLDKHPDGLCVPCCFGTWDKGGQPDRRKKCLDLKETSSDNKSIKSRLKEERDEYIKGPDKFPLDQNRWGYLPLIIQRFLNYDNSKCYISKLNTNLKKDTPCLIRQGVELNKKKSFVACISDLYSFNKSLDEGKNEIEEFYFYNIEEMITILCNSLTIDNFITYQNGNLPQLFKLNTNDKSKYLKNIEDHKKSNIYKQLKKNNDNNQLFEELVISIEYFKEFLKDKDNIVDHTYLWDIICTPNEKLFKRGINIIILEISQDDITNNVKVICPSNHFSNELFDDKKKTLLLIKKYDYYEPVYIANDNSKIRKYTLERGLDFNSIPELTNIFEFIKTIYNNMCKPLKSINENITFSQNKILNVIKKILETNKFKISHQVLNYDFKTIGLLVERINDCENMNESTKIQNKQLKGFVPCYPSSVDDTIDIKYFDDDIWMDYEETIYFLMCVKKITSNSIECNPDYKIIDDKLVVGILTHTNQFIPLVKPEQNIHGDTIAEINNTDYLFTDKKIKISKKNDSDREDYIKKIELETKKYNDFRNLFKLLINKYENIMKKKELEHIIYSESMLYIMKLDNTIIILKDILMNNVIFKPYDKSFSKENTLLVIPFKNLINEYDNQTLYYGRLADEIIRYNRIKQFIFEPSVYLSFHNIKYNLLDNEVILLHSLLFSDYFIDLEAENKNNFILNNSYDTVNPIKSQYYSSNYVEKKATLELISSCESNIKPIYGKWEKELPYNYKEIIFSNETNDCSFDILSNIFEKKSLSEYKNLLVNLYEPYIKKYSTKLLDFISEYNLKKEIKLIRSDKLTLKDLILSDKYILTNLDIILLSQYFDIPVILLSSKNFFENNSNIIKTKNSFYFFIIRSPVFYLRTVSDNISPKYRLYMDNNNNKIIDFKNVSNYLKSIINNNNVINVDEMIQNFDKKNVNIKEVPIGKLKIRREDVIELDEPKSITETIETQPIIVNTSTESSGQNTNNKKKIKLKLLKNKE